MKLQKANLVNLAESELDKNAPIPLIENFSGFESTEATSRLVIYVSSEIHVEINVYEDSPTAIIVNIVHTSFGFSYTHYTEIAYTKLNSRV